MPIIYALVARGTIILAEHAITTGNFATITQHLLAKIPSSGATAQAAGGSTSSGSTHADSRMSYVYDNYMFHYLQRRRVPFAFLEDMAARFIETYGDRSQTAISYGLNEYSKAIASLMEEYTHGNGDKVTGLRGEIDQVKDIMINNIEKVLERGDRIDMLVDKTESLSQASFAFKKRSTVLRRSMWWKNTKLMVLLAAAVALLIFFTVIGSMQAKGDHYDHYTAYPDIVHLSSTHDSLLKYWAAQNTNTDMWLTRQHTLNSVQKVVPPTLTTFTCILKALCLLHIRLNRISLKVKASQSMDEHMA
ncbi:hypothetical protein BDEG_23226 [Batrachochytrium dendrobatidis JEL423]|uniref:Synaptobrevin homolog YKT6 n=1 Tax=Batrachochytrium dendrobatidis (strain JEL423) TaxID=403673 RepID=A0A177WH28_BATDL|nr:hypothetical protein BDEG_23226 [Batrachochytrium dendrobatidis JEL423]